MASQSAHTEKGGANEWGNSPRSPLTQMNCESLVYTGNMQWASMAAWATMSGLSGGLGGGGFQEGRQLRPKDWVGRWGGGGMEGGAALWHTEPGTEASTDGRGAARPQGDSHNTFRMAVSRRGGRGRSTARAWHPCMSLLKGTAEAMGSGTMIKLEVR